MFGKRLQNNKLEQGQGFTCNHTIYGLIAKQSGFDWNIQAKKYNEDNRTIIYKVKVVVKGSKITCMDFHCLMDMGVI